MMLNKPMFDWLTLTTYDIEAVSGMYYLLFPEDPEVKTDACKRLQYKGYERDGHFWGSAIQAGKMHYMWQSSGEAAHAAYLAYRDNYGPYDFNVTRCDLQVTISLPEGYDSRQLYDTIDRWDGPGRKRQVSIIQSGDKNDTVYIGSRTSDRFTRIYVKPLDVGGKALRFECEFKGDHAHSIFHSCCRDERHITQTLSYEVQSLPIEDLSCHWLFLDVLGWNDDKPPIKRVTGENSTLQWLRDTVTPSLKRLANSHDYHDAIVVLVQQWYTDIVEEG